MQRPIEPSPATSTTFSFQLSKTLITAVTESFDTPGLPPTWLKPPEGWGVTRVGVLGALPDEDEDAIPL
jgi:hypothetical protein